MSDIKLGLVYEIRYLNYPAFNVLVKLALSQILGKGKQTSESKHIDEIRTKSEYPTTLNCIIWAISIENGHLLRNCVLGGSSPLQGVPVHGCREGGFGDPPPL